MELDVVMCVLAIVMKVVPIVLYFCFDVVFLRWLGLRFWGLC